MKRSQQRGTRRTTWVCVPTPSGSRQAHAHNPSTVGGVPCVGVYRSTDSTWVTPIVRVRVVLRVSQKCKKFCFLWLNRYSLDQSFPVIESEIPKTGNFVQSEDDGECTGPSVAMGWSNDRFPKTRTKKRERQKVSLVAVGTRKSCEVAKWLRWILEEEPLLLLLLPHGPRIWLLEILIDLLVVALSKMTRTWRVEY